MEIVSSAPSQPVVPVVELSSDDEMDKSHESDDDDEEESGPFVQTEEKPSKAAIRDRHQGLRRTTGGWRRRSEQDGLQEESLGKPKRK